MTENTGQTQYLQDALPFIGVQDNLIINRDGTFSMVLRLSGLNLQLMSAGEKQGLHRRLGSLFNLLEGHSFQFLAVIRTRDVKPLIDDLAEARDKETIPQLMEQAYLEHDYLDDLVREGGIISRDYYLIVRLEKTADDEEKTSMKDDLLEAFGFQVKKPVALQQSIGVSIAVRDRASVLSDTLLDGLRGIGFVADVATADELESLLTYLLNGVGQGGDLTDRCVPGHWTVERDYLQLGDDVFVAGLYATTFPMHVRMGWLEALLKQPEQMVVSIQFEIMKGVKAEKKLSGKASLLEAMEMAGNGEQQKVAGMRRAYQMDSANLMIGALAREEEKIGFFGVRVLAQANTEKDLIRRTRRIEQKMAELRLVPASALLHQDRFLISILPLAMDDIASDYNRRNATTSGMVCAIPNVIMDLGHQRGMALGINKQDRSLVVLDRFNLTSYHKIIVAETGSGKTVSEAIETIRGLLRGWQYVWFDPQNTLMPQLIKMTGGEIIDLGPDAGAIINPMDWGTDDKKKRSLPEKVIFLTSLIQLMAERTLDASEKSRLARTIRNCYEDNPGRTPILQDLVAIMPGENLGNLSEELERFIDPHIYGTMFNGQTNVALGNRHVSFNLRDLDETQLRPIRIFQALEYTWQWIKQSTFPPKVMVVDEIGLLLRFPDIAQYVRDLFKRGRAFNLSVVAIDQNPANFIENPFGRQMIENAALIQLMKQNELGVELLRQHFRLTQGEVDSLLSAEPGDALLIVEGKRLHMRFSISPKQLDLLSTRPEDVAKRKEG